MTHSPPHHPLAIIGGGIGGLTLALCLDQVYNHRCCTSKEDSKLEIHVYESTAAYTKEAGGAIGLYPNGLRVLRNLSRGLELISSEDHMKFDASSPSLLDAVRAAGCPYIYRRWMRHDGTEVAVAREDELLPESETVVEATGGNPVNKVIDNRRNSLAGLRADNRPRGGSFRVIKETADILKQRLSRISFASDSTDTTVDSVVSTSTAGRSSDVSNIETELLSLGIRRWKYQQVLYEACQSAGIIIHFGKRLQGISSVDSNDDVMSLLTFKDGYTCTASLVIGADGINSKVRNYIANPTNNPEAAKRIEEYNPEYTGVTCLMGCANVSRPRGISFPSSATTKCHACYYPTCLPDVDDSAMDEQQHGGEVKALDDSQYEQVFQIYFPSPIERPDTWRTLTPEESKTECRDLAKKLREDGWDEQFLKPLESETLTGVLRVGLRSREALDVWHVSDGNARACLLGDAAHPPVPYIGQGAMMAMEDAGTLSLLLAKYCPLKKTDHSTLDYTHFTKAMHTYETLRVNRTKAILGSSVTLGQTQQKRAESKLYNAYREWSIKAQVWAYGTLPVMRPGAGFNYVGRVEEVLNEDND